MCDIDDFLRRFGEYLAKANESKKRGNNDYNPLKAVQNPYNEVNMHSGFIYSLLDTNGEHYQDDLFLSLFLEVLGLKEWFGSTTNAQTRKEDKYIDLYVFNDTKHIIIENKINAGDQPNQIAIFIEQVHKDGVEYEDIFVIFLTLHDREPSQNSRTSKDNNLLWEIKGEFLESKKDEKINRVGYKKVLYENEILEWIESCQSKSGVGNIANLNYALESYKDIVQIITNKRKSTMSVADFFKEAEDFEMAFEILSNIDNIADKYLATYFLKNIQELLDKQQWIVEFIDEYNWVCIYDKEFENSECPFFYFCCYWYKNDRGKSRFWCAIMLDNLNDRIEQILKDLKCQYYRYQGNSIGLSGKGLDCGNIRSIKDLENTVVTFIKSKTNEVQDLNSKIKEATL